jgi:hypothetical protein
LPVIHVDDQEFDWEDFDRLLYTHAGWGMRIVFVPGDELDRSRRSPSGSRKDEAVGPATMPLAAMTSPNNLESRLPPTFPREMWPIAWKLAKVS